MSPLRDTVRLVYGEQRQSIFQLHLFQQCEKIAVKQTFGRDVQ